MGSIPLPALDLKPVQQPDALGSVEKMMALKSMMGQQQLQQGQIQLQQQKVKDQQLVQQDLQANPHHTFADAADALHGKITPEAEIALRDSDAKIVQQHAAATQDQLNNGKAIHQRLSEIYNNAMNLPDDQLAAQTPQIAQQVNSIPGSQFKIDPSQPLTKDKLKEYGVPLALNEAYLKQEAAKKEQAGKTQEEAASTAEKSATADQKVQETAWYKAHGMAPGVPAETQGMADWLAKNPGKGPSDYQIAMKKVVPAFQFNLQSGLMTDQAKDMAAENYYQTGQLPAGARSPAIISGIINRAAELHPGGNLAGNKAAFEANKASYENVTKTLDTLSAFESAGLKNLKQFTDLADKLPDTGVPWANTPVRLLNKNLVGNEYMPAIEAARTVALREIARVTNDPKLSGVLTDSARQEVSALSPENATLPQIKHVVHVLQQDMANVHSSLGAQKADIGKRLGFTQQQEQTNNPSPEKPKDFFSNFGGKQR